MLLRPAGAEGLGIYSRFTPPVQANLARGEKALLWRLGSAGVGGSGPGAPGSGAGAGSGGGAC